MSIIVNQGEYIKILFIKKFNLVEDVKYIIIENLISLCHRIDYRHFLLMKYIFHEDIRYIIKKNLLSLIKLI
jgi:hypothetical protein